MVRPNAQPKAFGLLRLWATCTKPRRTFFYFVYFTALWEGVDAGVMLA